MNKRILSFLLAAVIIVSVLLTGCSSDKTSEEAEQNVNKEASSSTKTISMYVVTENEVSEKDQRLVSAAFNTITKAKFKTQVVIHFLTYENYYPTIEGLIEANLRYQELRDEHASVLKDAQKRAKASGITTDLEWFDKFYAEHPQYADFRETEELTGEDTTAEETVLVTIEGIEGVTLSEIKYPDERANQLDILWIDSYDTYMKYIDNEWLSRLDDELTSSSKKIKEYIQPSLLAWAKWAGSGTYGIPNNHAIGSYTYLLLNRELIDKYHYDVNDMNSLAKCENYLNDIAKYENDVQLIVGDLPVTGTFYWTYDAEGRKILHDEFSLIGNTFSLDKTLDPTSSTNSYIGAKNIFTVLEYTNQLKAIQKYKDAGYISETAADGKKIALQVVKGGAELQAKYRDEYYMVALETPRIEEEDVFGSMFAVSYFTRSLSRSMEVITYLNTNSDLRNVLQYGVKGVHYDLNPDGTLYRLNNDYMMDIRKTGNAFVAYPEEGSDPDVWTYGKVQNSSLRGGLINCFRVTDDDLNPSDQEKDALNVNDLVTLRNESAEIYRKLQAVNSYEELEAFIAEYSTYLSTIVKNNTNMNKTSGIYGVYSSWLTDKGLYVAEE